VAEVPRVAMIRSPGISYPHAAPFDPSERYPELQRLPGGHPPLSAETNHVYTLVRRALAEFGLDATRFGTWEWNPFQGLVPPQGLVVLKPNLVLEATESGDAELALTTHASVIRVLVDYVRLAGGADVEILIGDVPLQGADFARIVQQNGLEAMVDVLAGRGDEYLLLRDLRRERAIVDATGFIQRLEQQPGDPRGYQEVDIGAVSRLDGLRADSFEGFAVTDYRQAYTQRAHSPGRHVYLLPRSVLAADLFINVPKLKTHQKAGITVAMKNLVGVNGDKSRIPHFRLGPNGDEYPPDQMWLRGLVSRTQRALQGRSRFLYAGARSVWRGTRRHLIKRTREAANGASTLVGGGAWFGNDTLWRALHDLNHIILFAGSDGMLHKSPQRRYLCIVDGIIAGEDDGPLCPVPRRDGIVLAGDDALAIDLVAAHYMGLDWNRIPLLADAVRRRPAWSRVEAPPDEHGIAIVPPGQPLRAERAFVPPPGWRDEVELEPEAPTLRAARASK
jgi:uncharacterized protein (DUF362 family)